MGFERPDIMAYLRYPILEARSFQPTLEDREGKIDDIGQVFCNLQKCQIYRRFSPFWGALPYAISDFLLF